MSVQDIMTLRDWILLHLEIPIVVAPCRFKVIANCWKM